MDGPKFVHLSFFHLPFTSEKLLGHARHAPSFFFTATDHGQDLLKYHHLLLHCSRERVLEGQKIDRGGEMARPGDRVRLQGLSREEYNSKEGVVKVSERAAAEGRLCIVLDGAGK